MNELVVADKATEWLRLKALVLDSISSPITKRVYNHPPDIVTTKARSHGFDTLPLAGQQY